MKDPTPHEDAIGVSEGGGKSVRKGEGEMGLFDEVKKNLKGPLADIQKAVKSSFAGDSDCVYHRGLGRIGPGCFSFGFFGGGFAFGFELFGFGY